MKAHTYTVTNPDGKTVPLTCTEQELQTIWIPAGYVPDVETEGDGEHDTPKRTRKTQD